MGKIFKNKLKKAKVIAGDDLGIFLNQIKIVQTRVCLVLTHFK